MVKRDSISTAIFMFLGGALAFSAQSEEVIHTGDVPPVVWVTTDKLSYRRGEPILVTIRNDLSENSLQRSKLPMEGSFSTPQGLTNLSPRIQDVRDVSNAFNDNDKQMSVGSGVKVGGAAKHSSESPCVVQVEANMGNSGIAGKTIFRVYSGMPEGETIERTSSMEFAIAPVEDDSPAYGKAIFIKSNEQGHYEVTLPPGRYWIGPKAKALDPKNFESPAGGSMVFSEKVAAVQEGVFTHVDVLQESFAP